jgi:ribosomal protein S18 acetylase RimI-like enzyme
VTEAGLDLAAGDASPAEARTIEELAANAWPAEAVEELDGWRLRASPDRTWRANSVWPNAHDGRLPVEERIARAEAFYAMRRAPVRFQICKAAVPAELDTHLAQRGYVVQKPTCVITAETAAVIERACPPGAPATALRTDLEEVLSAAWLDAYVCIQGFDGPTADARRQLFERIVPPHCHVRVSRAGEVIAVGVGVAERGWAGVYSLATAPGARRMGAGTTVLSALLGWARGRGATRAYLQVEADNASALALYAGLGFGLRYAYHYRVWSVGRTEGSGSE